MSAPAKEKGTELKVLMTHRPSHRAWMLCLCTAMLAVWGCGETAPGALGQIDFAPECGSLDQACLEQSLNAPIAAGATVEMGINFKFQGSSGPPMRMEAIDEAAFKLDGSRVEAVKPGVRPLMVIGPDGLVLDFIHLWVAVPDELRLVSHTDAGLVIGPLGASAQMLPGDELNLTVEPFANSQALLGDFDVEWEVTGDAVAILQDGVLGAHRIVARQPGQASLTATALGLSIAVDVEVLP